MDSARPQLLVLADGPDAFCTLFGISMLERLLRVAQRLGFSDAVILSSFPEEVASHLARPSWARAEVALSLRPRSAGAVRVSDLAPAADRVLVVSAGFYYDARLLKALAEQTRTTLLVDSAPPSECALLWRDGNPGVSPQAAALIDSLWCAQQDSNAALFTQLSADAAAGRIELCDATAQPTYMVALRKHVRPVFFPAPLSHLEVMAERFPRNAAQNGTLDFPGILHSPIEDWIVARLCHTSVTPNQVTFVTMLIGLVVTALFVTGHLWWGIGLACAVGVLDGVDGKLARTKVETTPAGKWEHVIDYCVELSWWTALAYHFHAEGLRFAFWLLLLLVGSDLIDRLAKRVVKQKVERNLDDVANIDRFVRWIGSRRNINIWVLLAALAFGDAGNGFVLICWWGAASAAVHLVRAFQIRFCWD